MSRKPTTPKAMAKYSNRRAFRCHNCGRVVRPRWGDQRTAFCRRQCYLERLNSCEYSKRGSRVESTTKNRALIGKAADQSGMFPLSHFHETGRPRPRTLIDDQWERARFVAATDESNWPDKVLSEEGIRQTTRRGFYRA